MLCHIRLDKQKRCHKALCQRNAQLDGSDQVEVLLLNKNHAHYNRDIALPYKNTIVGQSCIGYEKSRTDVEYHTKRSIVFVFDRADSRTMSQAATQSNVSVSMVDRLNTRFLHPLLLQFDGHIPFSLQSKKFTMLLFHVLT